LGWSGVFWERMEGEQTQELLAPAPLPNVG
jgi:hypothetical protein